MVALDFLHVLRGRTDDRGAVENTTQNGAHNRVAMEVSARIAGIYGICCFLI